MALQWSIAAGIAAPMASAEYHNKNIRSTNIISDHEPVEMIKAICTTSLPPHFRAHHVSFVSVVSAVMAEVYGGRLFLSSGRLEKNFSAAFDVGANFVYSLD
jgi:hypothetical protein